MGPPFRLRSHKVVFWPTPSYQTSSVISRTQLPAGSVYCVWYGLGVLNFPPSPTLTCETVLRGSEVKLHRSRGQHRRVDVRVDLDTHDVSIGSRARVDPGRVLLLPPARRLPPRRELPVPLPAPALIRSADAYVRIVSLPAVRAATPRRRRRVAEATGRVRRARMRGARGNEAGTREA